MATLYKVKNVNGVYTQETLEVKPESGETFSLSELQDFVGGYIEIVELKNDKIMVVNEAGKLLKLPLNQAATQIYAEIPLKSDFIFGNALVCEPNEID